MKDLFINKDFWVITGGIVHTVITAFVASGWYKTHTNLLQRAYLNVLWRELDKKVEELGGDPSLWMDTHTAVIGAVLASSNDPAVKRSPAVKAANKGNFKPIEIGRAHV